MLQGKIERIAEGKFVINGIVNKIDDVTVEVTELPVGFWTQNYKEQLEKWITGTDNNPAVVKVREYLTPEPTQLTSYDP